MACGTGKTLVGYEVAQRLKVRRDLVLVPSLLLVQQMIREYRSWGAENILAVCSDDVASGEDAIQVSVNELDADTTTDARQARAFLNGKGRRIVVCTYQSLRPLADVFKALAFDLAVFDEAHKTAGVRSKLFAHGLTDDSVKCARRLFLTATPRHATLKEDGKEAQVFAMNDPKIYGPVLYSLPLRAAIEAGIIDDYRIIVAMIPQKETAEMREQATRVAIERAMRVYGIRKVFTFHDRVATAEGFVLGATQTLKGARLYHVNGQQTATTRALKLEGFRAADAALMSNARCLTEGVDLPAADMVAFLSPKRNAIDIVQAVGRVLRKHHTKVKGGYVFLPVFVREGTDEEVAIAESNWSGVYEVLQAMREQDEPLAVALAKCARGEGDLPEKIVLMHGTETPESDLGGRTEKLRQVIRVKMVKPFRIDAAGKKKELIALAAAGSALPKQRTPLGLAFKNYTTEYSSAFDRSFLEQIKRIAPAWLRGAGRDPASKKEALLALARSGTKRPVRYQHQLGSAFCNYINRTSRGFDPIFRAQIEQLAPAWVKPVRDLKGRQEELLQLARTGATRPPPSTKLGKALNYYLSDHPAFTQTIKGIAPQWFIRTSDVNKKELLRLASQNEKRPIAKLGGALSRYTSPANLCYDAVFDAAIRRIAPRWFTKSSQQMRKT